MSTAIFIAMLYFALYSTKLERRGDKVQPLIILFECPNDQDGWHEKDFVVYLLIPEWAIYRKHKDRDGYEPIYSYFIAQESDAFVLVDYPSEGLLTGIIGKFPNAQIIRQPHLCDKCKKAGIKLQLKESEE